MSKEQSGAIDTPSVYPISIVDLAKKLDQLISYLAARQELDKFLDFDFTSTENNNAVHDYHTALTTAFQNDSKGKANCEILYKNALKMLSMGNDEPLYVFLHNHRDIMECIENHLPALKKTLDTREKPPTYSFLSSSAASTTRRRRRSFSASSLEELLSLTASLEIESTPNLQVKANNAANVANKAIATINEHGDGLLRDLATNPQAVLHSVSSGQLLMRYQEEEFYGKKLREILDTFAQLEPTIKQNYVDAIQSKDKEALSTFLRENDGIRKLLHNCAGIITELSTNYADRSITHTVTPHRPKPTYGAMLKIDSIAPDSPVRPTQKAMDIVVSALQHQLIREKMVALMTQPGETPTEQAIAALFSPLSMAQKEKWRNAINDYRIVLRPIQTLLQDNEPITRVLAEHINNLPKTPITIQISDATYAGTLTVPEQKLSK